MGRRLVGAAVAGMLVLGGGVVVAAPASAVPVVGTAGAVRTAPAVPRVRDGARVHRIIQVSGSKSKSKTKTKTKVKVKRGFLHGFFHGFLGWFTTVLLAVLLMTLLVVLWVRRSNRPQS
ncbi:MULTISPECIES: hypothetical protein [unclassified Kitasatospora]|uniref:hypothetical protein n=1 Tax=unclassified Kitasatospora TaxID=2633591 RepID=UPI0033E6A631